MRRDYFTLLELLVAIAVIAVLAGLTVGGARFAFQRSEEATIRSRLQKLEMALESYRRDWGYYPVWPYQPYTPSPTFYINAANDFNPANPLRSPAGADYLEESTTPFRQSPSGPAVRYQYPGLRNPQKYDLVAPGVDENFGNENGTAAQKKAAVDNITNWTKP